MYIIHTVISLHVISFPKMFLFNYNSVTGSISYIHGHGTLSTI